MIYKAFQLFQKPTKPQFVPPLPKPYKYFISTLYAVCPPRFDAGGLSAILTAAAPNPEHKPIKKRDAAEVESR